MAHPNVSPSFLCRPHTDARACFHCIDATPLHQEDWALPWEGCESIAEQTSRHWDLASRAGFDCVALEFDDDARHETLVLFEDGPARFMTWWDPFASASQFAALWPHNAPQSDLSPHMTLADTARIVELVYYPEDVNPDEEFTVVWARPKAPGFAVGAK
jgi:hypothetical protein